MHVFFFVSGKDLFERNSDQSAPFSRDSERSYNSRPSKSSEYNRILEINRFFFGG